MDEPSSLEEPDSPADMDEVKRVCALIQEGRITWEHIVAFHDRKPVRLIDWSRTPEEDSLISALRHHLSVHLDGSEASELAFGTLVTYLFDRAPAQWPETFIAMARPAA